MKISKRAQYGLRAMVYLAKNHASRQAEKNNKAVSIRELSNMEHIPFEFLSKIFADLERANLVKAKHGANGGYFLAKKPDKITPGDIVRVLEEEVEPVHCTGCPMANSCTSQDVWEEVKDSINSALDASTLAELAKKKK